MTDPQTTLHLAGERTVPGVAEENYWFRRHEIAYQELLPHCVGRAVLEAGCGEGYGAAMIADRAASVLALDYDLDAVRHVHAAYGVPAVQADLGRIPVRTGAVEVIMHSQVLEHLPDQEGFLADCHRVLRPGGILLVTTPNRLTFSPGRDTPLNPYHTRELAPAELAGLLGAAGFEVRELLGVHHGPGLCELDTRYGGSIIDAQLEVVLHSLPGQASWPSGLLADVTAIRAEDFVLHAEALDESLDLVAVAVRP
ncbi:class I SAM-dependent methyltransferase [Sciscionella marina]|uniref:class I SAM-dependent methyltransferase n=1 Tax=Sciscionella marina TaxID=508770 RepID=UPI0003601E43|nr:class I SAM-dependent methyltransferase [Sciscionella marina]